MWIVEEVHGHRRWVFYGQDAAQDWVDSLLRYIPPSWSSEKRYTTDSLRMYAVDDSRA
jgi:hypothetical protein